MKVVFWGVQPTKKEFQLVFTLRASSKPLVCGADGLQEFVGPMPLFARQCLFPACVVACYKSLPRMSSLYRPDFQIQVSCSLRRKSSKVRCCFALGAEL